MAGGKAEMLAGRQVPELYGEVRMSFREFDGEKSAVRRESGSSSAGGVSPVGLP